MKNYWSCDDIPRMIKLFLKCKEIITINNTLTLINRYVNVSKLFINLNDLTHSNVVVKMHYEISNKMYSEFLGKTMAYTCAYWENGAKTLDEAQTHKLEMICQKLKLNEKDIVLDIGCGWGSFVIYAAKHYKCKIVGCNLSQKHLSYAKKWSKDENLETFTEFINCDYRLLPEKYDGPKFTKIVSVGFFEHVGKNGIII
jgi:cyclopropane-fatty-acyl-phospholipid synthase